MGQLDATFSNTVLAFMTAQSATAPVSPLHLRLMTVVGSATVLGTELATGGSPGYTSGTGAPTITFGSPGSQLTSSSVAVTLTGMPAVPSPGIAGTELWDSAGTPKRIIGCALTGGSKIVNSGDTFSFAIAGVTLGIS